MKLVFKKIFHYAACWNHNCQLRLAKRYFQNFNPVDFRGKYVIYKLKQGIYVYKNNYGIGSK